MSETQERKHEIDLVQIERIRRLSIRLQRDLALYDQLTQAIALQESQMAFEQVELVRAPALDKEESVVEGNGRQRTPAEQIEQLAVDQVKMLRALKMSVWNAAVDLKEHSRRWKSVDEQED